jgi:hypothetical protein
MSALAAVVRPLPPLVARRPRPAAARARASPRHHEFTPSREEFQAAIEYARQAAEEVCEASEKAVECALMWEVVEELSAAAADARPEALDPIDVFCDDDPSAVECRSYDV